MSVADNGKGIAAEIMDKIFIPFFTTRKNGSGIGLSLSENMMRVHHGSIKVKTVDSQTVFLLTFYN